MQDKSLKLNSGFFAIIAIVSWFAVVLQLYLIILNRVVSLPETIVRFFSFFTIQTNILVAVCFAFLWLKPKSKWGLFFLKPKKTTAITLYITIVGLVYNVILRFSWAPTGLQKVVDELLHSVIPILVLLYWILFVPKKELEFKNIFPWLIFPLGYLIYTLIRGAFFNFYPYPFVDVNVLGYSAVLLNSFFMLLAFLFFGTLLIGIGKMKRVNSESNVSTDS
ncbi:Pr6Pr family membrane protein [Flavobacterium sp. LB2P84]|uniref:Pr6Pr family membrane protein n=1 Tax=Flavobacterium yafengii TaxID=3041253 RepID=UPI0024A998A8|nr:Pr6Pr family membrane protein [Flavobacterium yafengii]MDI6034670.1 Pr6Pr family membrane protein [Flavobacterium yafengii]